MNILITGGAGFLGSNLCIDLLSKGHMVTVVDNLITGNKENITHFLKNSHFKFYELGVDSQEFIDEFLAKDTHTFERVYHLACPTGVPNIEYLGEEMVDTCSLGTKNVLKVALKNNATVLFTSSSEVYGDPEIFPQAESYTGNVDPQGWRASYEEGKRFSETLVALFVKKHGLNAKTVRLFNVYGPYMNFRDQRVIPRFVQQALKNEPLTVHDNVALRTMCYVSDIVNGLQLVIEKGEPGGVYNLGSDQEISMKDLAKKVIEATESRSEIALVPGMEHDHKRRMPDLTKVRALGWNCGISLNEGLILTIENFKQRLAKNVVV